MCPFKWERKEQGSNYHDGEPLQIITCLFLPAAGSHILLLPQNAALLDKRRWILSLIVHCSYAKSAIVLVLCKDCCEVPGISVEPNGCLTAENTQVPNF